MTEIIVVRVKPGSRKGPLVDMNYDGELTVYVRERAVDGRANQAVIALLADHLGVGRGQVQLVAGSKSRIKRFKIT